MPTPLSKKIIGNREWERIDYGFWTVFAHINPNGYPKGHSHNDSGSISAFYDGIPILVDAGRRHYVEDVDGQRGRNCWSHTILVVDGINPTPNPNRFYPKQFMKMRIGHKPVFRTECNLLEIKHNGYARIKGVSTYSRTISCSEDSIEIVDTVEGKGIHEITLLFQIPYKTIANSGKFFFKPKMYSFPFLLITPSSLLNHQLWNGPSPDRRFGWGSIQYGDVHELCSVVVSGRVKLPWTGRTILTLEN